jgi:hypothetical protein
LGDCDCGSVPSRDWTLWAGEAMGYGREGGDLEGERSSFGGWRVGGWTACLTLRGCFTVEKQDSYVGLIARVVL